MSYFIDEVNTVAELKGTFTPGAIVTVNGVELVISEIHPWKWEYNKTENYKAAIDFLFQDSIKQMTEGFPKPDLRIAAERDEPFAFIVMSNAVPSPEPLKEKKFNFSDIVPTGRTVLSRLWEAAAVDFIGWQIRYMSPENGAAKIRKVHAVGIAKSGDDIVPTLGLKIADQWADITHIPLHDRRIHLTKSQQTAVSEAAWINATP